MATINDDEVWKKIEEYEKILLFLPLLREEMIKQLNQKRQTIDQVMQWYKSQMIICPQCGQDVYKRANFCLHCGIELFHTE